MEKDAEELWRANSKKCKRWFSERLLVCLSTCTAAIFSSLVEQLSVVSESLYYTLFQAVSQESSLHKALVPKNQFQWKIKKVWKQKVSTHKAAYSQNMQKSSRSFKPSRNQQKRAHHVKSGPILSCSKRTKKHDFLADLKELKRWIKGTFNRPFSRRQSERPLNLSTSGSRLIVTCQHRRPSSGFPSKLTETHASKARMAPLLRKSSSLLKVPLKVSSKLL